MPVSGELGVNMFAIKTVWAMVGISISLNLFTADLANEVFLAPNKVFWHRTILAEVLK